MTRIIFEFRTIRDYQDFVHDLERRSSGDITSAVLEEIIDKSLGLKVRGLKSSHSATLSPEEHSEPARRPSLLNQAVVTAMNRVYFGESLMVNLEPIQHYHHSKLWKSARDYFLRLLENQPLLENHQPEYAEKQAGKAPETMQGTVDRALVAYLAFNNNDRRFLFRDPRGEALGYADKTAAQKLIQKVQQSTYTKAAIADRVYAVLLGAHLRTIPEYQRFQTAVSSPDRQKDQDVIAYYNQIKGLVVTKALEILKVTG